MHEPNIGGAVPANPIERLAPPLDFGCTRLFEWVHLLNAARNGIPKPKFFGNCNPCLFVTFCGLKNFSACQLATKGSNSDKNVVTTEQRVNLLMPELKIHRLTDYFLANTETWLTYQNTNTAGLGI